MVEFQVLQVWTCPWASRNNVVQHMKPDQAGSFHRMADRSPSDDAVQVVPLNSSANSVSDTLDLEVVLVLKLTLHPIEIPNVSTRRVIVAVDPYSHVPFRVMKYRRATAPGNKNDVL